MALAETQLHDDPVQLLYAATVLVAAYLQFRGMQPPNAAPDTSKQAADSSLFVRDTLSDSWDGRRRRGEGPPLAAGQWPKDGGVEDQRTPYANPFARQHFFGRSNILFPLNLFLTLNGVLHAFYSIYTPTGPSAVCPSPSGLDRTTLTWVPLNAAALAAVITGGLIRITAYAQLGKNFTYVIARPSRLMTGGLYGYVQHPSYTGTYLQVSAMLLTTAWGEYGWGCFTPAWALPYLPLASVVNVALMSSVLWLTVPQRIVAEEKMMKESFGKEWEEYHRRTARLIPGVF